VREGAPSRTAFRVALRRAAHQLLDNPKVLDDPWAVPILGDAINEIQTRTAVHQSRLATHFRAFIVARSRYAEDQLAISIERGVCQYVVLGAGLDTSAYRGVALTENLRVFEVDHPQTQAWKKQHLQSASIPIPASVTFVPVNFEKQNLETELLAAGFRGDQPAFVSWLGVVPYLTKEAASHTFQFIGRFPESSGVAFDYAVEPSSLPFLQRVALAALSRRVALAGEPFRLFFEPNELDGFLKARSFRGIKQLGTDQINQRYFSGRTDRLKLAGSAGRIVSAWT
jgi:methyltransferase (TIGR00027 family)